MLQGGKWSQSTGLCHIPARRMLSLPGATFSQAISKTQGEIHQETPHFFSCIICFNPSWVLWTWWLSRAPKGWSWASRDQPHLGGAQTHFLGSCVYLKESWNHGFRQEHQLRGSSLEFSCTEPLLMVIIKDCRPLPGTCAKNPVKSKCVKVWKCVVSEHVGKECI